MGETKSFWATLPGILTGVAGILTAIGGLLLALQQTGFIGQGQHNNIADDSSLVEHKKEFNEIEKPPDQPKPPSNDTTPPNRKLEYSPSQPVAGKQITFSATASDAESGIQKIEMYVMWDKEWHLVRTCQSDSCEWVGGPFQKGLLGFNAIAHDHAGNTYPGSPGQWELYITVK